MSLEPGDLIQDKYRIIRLIGQGGMGAVYEGENVVIARRVAIKVLHGMLAGDEGVIERFEREAQAAGRIGNDHILEVLDMGRLANNDRFMVMEYLEGETLDARCERLGRLSEDQIYPLIRQLLTGLSAAHAAGIVHRDLKPDNIFILRQKVGHADFVKIIDFGISKFTAGGANFRMTMTGAIMGTPYYMAPEQAKGSSNSDIRSDVYAVGVVMYRVLTGQVPFQADTFNELIFKIALSETPRMTELVPSIDPALDAIVARAMARATTDRYQTAVEFRDALDAWAEQRGLVNGGQLGSQIGLEREVRARASSVDHIDLPPSTVPVPESLTHEPWSNSGMMRTLAPSRWKWWVGAAAVLLGGVLVWRLSGDGESGPTDEGVPPNAAAESVPAVSVTPPPQDRPAVPPPTADRPRPELPVTTEAAASSAPTASAKPLASAAPKPAPAPRPVVAPRPKPSPAPAPRPVVAPRPVPKPVAKPAPKPVAKPKARPSDLLGY